MRLVLCLFALGACTQPAPGSPLVAASATSVPSAAASVGTPPLVPAAAAAAKAAPTKLDVLFSGPCAKPSVGHVGDRPAFAFEANVVYFEGTEPRELYRTAPVFYNQGHGSIGEVGGADPAHAWLMLYLPSRGDGYDGNLLFAARKWKNTQYLKGAHADEYHANGVVEQPDGAVWSFATEAWFSDSATTDHFAAWSADGTLLDAHLPGKDMAGAERLASGELVVGRSGKKDQLVLRRWSPSHPVGDLVAPDALAVHEGVTTRVGTARTVLATEAPKGTVAFYSYAGDALQRLELPIAVGPKDSWQLTRDDDLYVAHGDDVVVHQHDGKVTRLTAPEPGTLANDPTFVWWLAASGTLYAKSEQGWTKVPLPDAPGISPEHGPSTLEYVRTVGTDTVVGVRYTEPGKKKKPVTMRTVYSSAPHGAPAHCGAPLRAGEVGRR